MHEIKKVLLLDWNELPYQIGEQVRELELFRRGAILHYPSELNPEHYRRGLACIEDYWKDQAATAGYKGTLEEFVEDYDLELDKWVIENFNFTEVDQVLIRT